MQTKRCPTRQKLSAYTRCALSEHDSEQVAEHLEQCATCEETVVALELNADTVLSGTSNPQGQADYEREPAFHEMMFRLRRAAARAADAPPTSRSAIVADGRQIRDYQLLEKIGEGGMGIVYRSLHIRLGKEVAIKILPSRQLADTEAVARFRREMEAVGKLDHPNVVRAMDAGDEDGTHYLVMELVDGVDLSALVRGCGPLPVPEACELIIHAARGLQYVHEHGMVHRDIKPSNLILSNSGQVKILDLGLTRLNSSTSENVEELTSTGQVMGTLDYMAPEQGDDSHEVDIRSDVYSLGATLYRLLCGKAPFAGKASTPLRKLKALEGTPAPPIRNRRADIPQELAAVIHRMLAKNPAERFAAPCEVATALAKFAEDADLQSLLTTHRQHDEFCPVQQKAAPEKDEISPSPEPAIPSGRARSRTLRRAIIATTVLLTIAFAFIVYRIQTNYGTIIVEIEDSAIEARLRQDGIVIHDTASNRSWTLKPSEQKVPAGKYALASGVPLVFTVTDDAGLEVKSNEFTLQRNGRVRVRVSAHAAAGDKTASPPPVASGTVVLRDGFESGKYATNWNSPEADQYGDELRVVNDVARTGKYCLRRQHSAALTYRQVGLYEDDCDEIVVEWWQMMPKDLPTGSQLQLAKLFRRSGGNDGIVTLAMADRHIHVFVPVEPRSEYVQVPLFAGKWHQIRYELRCNDVGRQNGLFRLWFDGQEVLSWNDVTYRKSDQVANGIHIGGGLDGKRIQWPFDVFIDDVLISRPAEGSSQYRSRLRQD